MRRTVRGAVAGLVRAEIPTAGLGVHLLGQHDADWILFLPESSPWVTITRSCGWWWPQDDVCVVTERPSVLRTEPVPGEDGEPRLHAADGPAVEYPDGWRVYAWHGTRVPSWVVEEPTVDRVAGERNVEVRRCAIERPAGPTGSRVPSTHDSNAGHEVTMNLPELLDRTDLEVLDHLERQVTIPVLDGPQAQGDLIVLPLAMVEDVVRVWPGKYWSWVHPEHGGQRRHARDLAGTPPAGGRRAPAEAGE